MSSTIAVRLMGDRWKASDKITATLQLAESLESQAGVVATALSLAAESELLNGFTLHPFKDKKIGEVFDLSKTPADLDLKGSPFIVLRKKAAAGGAAAPPPPPKKSKGPPPGGGGKAPPPPQPQPKKSSVPPPPPKKSAVPPPPQPKKSKGAPPPPQPKKSKIAPPPPQPKKSAPSPTPSSATPAGSDSDSDSDRSESEGRSSSPSGPQQFPVPGAGGGGGDGGSDTETSSDGGRDSSDEEGASAASSSPPAAAVPPPPPPKKSTPTAGSPKPTTQAPPQPSPAAASKASAPTTKQQQPPPRPQPQPQAAQQPGPQSSPSQPATPSAASIASASDIAQAVISPPQARQPRHGEGEGAAGNQQLVVEGLKAKAEINTLVSQAEERFHELQRQQLSDDRERMDRLHHDLTGTMQRELNIMKETMGQNFESQRSRVLQQQNDLETSRRELLSKLVERERQLHDAQSDLLLKFQKRVGSQTTGGAAAIEELRLTNQTLRDKIEALTRRQNEAQDKELGQVMELQSKIVDTMTTLQSPHRRGLGGGSPHSPSSMAAAYMLGPNNDGSSIMRMQELTRFLASLGLEKYLETLMVHDVDVSALGAMSDLELEAVGVATVGARRRIQVECERRRQMGHSNTIGGGLSVSRSLDQPGGDGTFGDTSGGTFLGGRSVAATASGGGGGIGATALTTKQRQLHVELLEDFLGTVDPAVQPRAAVMINTFADQLEDLYTALCVKYDVGRSPCRGVMIHFLKRHHGHLLPAVDLICSAHRGREAEFADALECHFLGLGRQSLTWLAYQRATTQSKEDGGGPPPLFFYSALVKMSQWEIPKFLVNTNIRVVKEVGFRSSLKKGDERENPRVLAPNPVNAEECRSQVYQYCAAIVALLMRHEPQRLAERDQLLEKYREREHVLLAELQALYGVESTEPLAPLGQ